MTKASSLPFLTARPYTKADNHCLKQGHVENPSAERYEYRSLGENQIRFLSLSVDAKTGFMICNFQHRDLKSSLGAYRAISYCWGNATPAYRVMCSDGRSLLVTKSAAKLLTYLIPRKPTDLYWIDQLCINQEDSKEKVSQVLLMGQIYSCAKQVLAWLGRGTEYSEKAVDFVGMLFKEIENIRNQHMRPSLTTLLSSPNTPRTMLSNLRVPSRWRALRDLLLNPWFERVWVMQEVIMACAEIDPSSYVKHPVLLCFEKRILGFDVLAEVLGILETDNLLLKLFTFGVTGDGSTGLGVAPPGLKSVRLFSGLRSDVSRKQEIRLYTGLQNAWDFKSSNDRDKLYAVRGFCSQALDANLPLDYDAPVEEIYTTWATVLLECHGWYPWQLHMAGIGLKRSYQNLPSWVPDFSSSSPWIQLRPETSRATEGPYYWASGPQKMPQLLVDRSTAKLRLRAILIDTIEAVFRPPLIQKRHGPWYRLADWLLLNPERKDHEARLQWLEDIQNFLKNSTSASESDETRAAQILWQTLISNYNADEATPDSVFWQAFESWYLVNEYLAGNLKSSVTATLALAHQGKLSEQATRFESLNAKAQGSQPVFGTHQKRLLGYGPTGLQVGDTLCIIQGMRSPFLLRGDTISADGENHEKRWRLVGACFVHSLMYGEGMDMGEMEDLVVV